MKCEVWMIQIKVDEAHWGDEYLEYIEILIPEINVCITNDSDKNYDRVDCHQPLSPWNEQYIDGNEYKNYTFTYLGEL